VPEEVVAEGLREYGQWRDAREHAIAAGSAPSLNVRTVTEWAAEGGEISDFRVQISDSGTGQPVELGDVRQAGLFDAPPPTPDDGASNRPPLEIDIIDLRARGAVVPAGGTRFGDLVHALLAAVPFSADRGAVDDLAAVHGRIVLATDEEMAAASAIVARVLSHPIMQRARHAEARGACRREAPVTCMVGRGEFVEGVVDLAFEEHGEWTVVDYKTDREIAADGEERYRRQVAFYAHAIAEATGQAARGVLVRV
jgi:hypothetical protein